MFDARNAFPISSAIADGTIMRAGGSLPIAGMPGMAHRTASFPIYRGVLR